MSKITKPRQNIIIFVEPEFDIGNELHECKAGITLSGVHRKCKTFSSVPNNFKLKKKEKLLSLPPSTSLLDNLLLSNLISDMEKNNWMNKCYVLN